MRFLVDECTGPAVARWLRSRSYEVFSVYEQARGLPDDEVLEKACTENWVLITNDKDFGEMVYREKRLHKGIVFLRLGDERAVVKIRVIQRLLEYHADHLADNFTVVTEKQVRFSRGYPLGRSPRQTPHTPGVLLRSVARPRL